MGVNVLVVCLFVYLGVSLLVCVVCLCVCMFVWLVLFWLSLVWFGCGVACGVFLVGCWFVCLRDCLIVSFFVCLFGFYVVNCVFVSFFVFLSVFFVAVCVVWFWFALV